MGDRPARRSHLHLRALLRPTSWPLIGRHSLPGVRLGRPRALDLHVGSRQWGHEQPCGRCEPDRQGLLSAGSHSGGEDARARHRPRRRVRLPDHLRVRLQRRPPLDGPLHPAVRRSQLRRRSRHGPVSVRTERPLPRRRRRHPARAPALAVCLSGRLLGRARDGLVALCLRAQPDERCADGLPLGALWDALSGSRAAARLGRDRTPPPGRREPIFPPRRELLRRRRMRSDIAIQADGVAKQYQLGRLGGSYDLLSERFGSLFRGRRNGQRRERFWALDDVSFEVARGETFGILGRNGAGKSTVLKVLSRVTPPTRGRVRIKGRVGALLEVGTGFNMELTGRENVFLNGAILGMRRSEIVRKFHDIVEFAEVERFIDTPVKRYSSGMYLRLAFSVAAHLEPEVLVVDEVLAVGDAAFQKKCIGKMHDVSEQGRTVLFVSHDMSAITRLCQRAILLDDGKVLLDGPTSRVVKVYLDSGFGTAAIREWSDLSKAPGND